MSTRWAVVLGGGLAGTLAAHVLAEQYGEVVIIERDRLPDGPADRKGVPQGRHAHVLGSGGALALEALLPGVLDEMVALGAHRLGIPDGVVTRTGAGWVERLPRHLFVMAASRPLMDWVVRSRVLGGGRVRVRDGSEAVGLVGDRIRVCGVRIRSRPDGRERVLDADVVVDARGQGSTAVRFLADLGAGRVAVSSVDAGLAYSTRVYQAPDGAGHFPPVYVQPHLCLERPGVSGGVLPVEGGRWMITLGGTRGAEPPTDEGGFTAFARALPDPVISRLMAVGTPLTAPRGYRSTANVRHHFEHVRHWPGGFVVVGDAVARFNPVYGHGMSTAIRSVTALRAGMERDGLEGDGARRCQRAVSREFHQAWGLSTALDALCPGVIGTRRPYGAKAWLRILDRLLLVAHSDPCVLYPVLEMYSLLRPPSSLFTAKVLAAAVRGPLRPPLTQPPFTAAERCVLRDAPH
ncbi:NAD(P)/FAD-dependent oxidoreductase [Streptomyces violascens]|uniref:NAD(P)/FAD-dependent oxidoreductase n=1 Tax=Streptomyces violascens TaxID=67381 RepID=UPI00369FFD6C